MPVAFPRSGSLTRRVVIASPTGVTDANTEADTDAGVAYTTIATVWANVLPLTNTSSQLEGNVTYQVTIRYRSDVTNGMHIQEASRNIDLEIMGVLDLEEAQRVLQLQCINRRYPPV